MNKSILLSLTFAFANLISVSASPGLAANNAVGGVRLVIQNESSEAIRCIAIVAHFLTKDVGTIAAKENQTVQFELYEDGGLAQGTFQGKAVFVENLRCGTDKNWTATSADIPLDLLRESTGKTVTAQCLAEDRLTCRMQ